MYFSLVWTLLSNVPCFPQKTPNHLKIPFEWLTLAASMEAPCQTAYLWNGFGAMLTSMGFGLALFSTSYRCSRLLTRVWTSFLSLLSRSFTWVVPPDKMMFYPGKAHKCLLGPKCKKYIVEFPSVVDWAALNGLVDQLVNGCFPFFIANFLFRAQTFWFFSASKTRCLRV